MTVGSSGRLPGTATSASGSDAGSSTPDPSTSTETGNSGDSTGPGASSTGETGDASSTSTGGSGSLPINCTDGGLPVRVDEGGEYATVSEGVAATPPGGTLWVCPGRYDESEPVEIGHDMSIVGAGRDLVSISSTATFGPDGAGGAFEVTNTSVTFEGFSLRGGRYGAFVLAYNGERVITFRNVRIGNTESSGVLLDRGAGASHGDSQAVFEDVIVEEVDQTNSPPGEIARAAVEIRGVQTSFIDTIIRDNLTSYGGLEIFDAEVSFEGGQMIHNEALAEGGGGAWLSPSSTTFMLRNLTIIDSDWGEGAAMDNAPDDVSCSGNGDGWLGAPVSAVCGNLVGSCCIPS